MPILQARTFADIADADWEQLARVDADPLQVAKMVCASEEIVAQKLADACLRIALRYSRKGNTSLMIPFLERADFLKSNFGHRLRA